MKEGEAWLAQSENIARKLDRMSARVSSPFDREPRLAKEFSGLRRKLSSVRHSLVGAHKESDLEGVQAATARAKEVLEQLEALAKKVEDS